MGNAVLILNLDLIDCVVFNAVFSIMSVISTSTKSLNLVVVVFLLGAQDYGNSTTTGSPVSG